MKIYPMFVSITQDVQFINLLMRGRPLTVHGSGGSVRSFLHARDVARAFDVVVHKGETGTRKPVVLYCIVLCG